MLASVTTRPVHSGFRTALVDPSSWEELLVCPICQQSEFLRDIGIVEGESRAAVTSVCMDCEHGFLRRRPSKEWFDQFYSREWDQRGQSLVKDNKVAVPPNAKVLTFCAPYLLACSNVLEVGAGLGSFLLAFKEQGHNVYGIERSEHCAKYVRDVLGIPCVYSSVESAKLSDKFGLIYLNHVLEHVSDPGEVIAIISTMLSEDGMIYLAVPDFWQEYPPQAFHYVPHLSLFTIKSISRLLARNGLRVIKTAVGREIQVLAVKANPTKEDIGNSDSASRSSFWDMVSHFVHQAFGGQSGRHTLVWFHKNGETVYRSQVFPGTRLTSGLIKMTLAARHALPKRVWKRVLPDFLASGRLRMLTVNLIGDTSLPVNVRHQGRGAPVWVK